MKAKEIPIHTPCGADWSKMSAVEAKARLCKDCNKVVRDVGKMSEGEVRAALASGPVCVRYLYDAHGNVIFGDAPLGATVVPASALLSKVMKSKWLAAAALAAVPLVFEACGGNDGNYGGGAYGAYNGVNAPLQQDESDDDATDDEDRKIQRPAVQDGGADAKNDR